MPDPTDMMIADAGIDEGIKKLTPERIEKTIRHVLDNETAARMKVYLETCVHCGLCAEACHTYLSRDRDPYYAPVSKVKNTLWEMIKRKGQVDGPFLKNAARIAFTECGACRRCSMYCPFGIDIAYQIMTVRRICNLLAIVPQYLQDTTNSHAVASNQMWVQPDDWVDTLMWQEEEAMSELAGARIPLDKEGADVLYSVIAPEPKILAQLIGNMAILMKAAKIDWTMPSADGWDNSNMAMYSGDFEVMGRVGACGSAAGQAHRHGRVRPRLPWGRVRRSQVAGLEAASHPDGACGGVLLRPDQERKARDQAQDRGARDRAGPVQHRARARLARQAPLRGQGPV
jgi:ferredoxin